MKSVHSPYFSRAFPSPDLDGGWSPWSSMATPCSKSCGGGINHRVRSCTHPVPSGAGALCTAEDNTEKEVEWKTYDCNTQSCWGETLARIFSWLV